MNSLRNLGTSTPTATFMVLTGSLRRVSSPMVRPRVGPSTSTFMLMSSVVTSVGSTATPTASGSCRPQPPRCGEVVS